MLKPEYEEVELGRAEVREGLPLSRSAPSAGCMVLGARDRRNARARLLRANNVVVVENQR